MDTYFLQEQAAHLRICSIDHSYIGAFSAAISPYHSISIQLVEPETLAPSAAVVMGDVVPKVIEGHLAWVYMPFFTMRFVATSTTALRLPDLRSFPVV